MHLASLKIVFPHVHRLAFYFFFGCVFFVVVGFGLVFFLLEFQSEGFLLLMFQIPACIWDLASNSQ